MHLFMWIVLLVFGLSLVPAVISAWISLRAQDKVQAELGRTMEAANQRGIRAALKRDRDLNYVEGLGYIIGDFTCQMNARSPYLRCAMNPCGPCEGCQFYEAPVFREVVQRVPETPNACPLPALPNACPFPRLPIPVSCAAH